MEGDRTRPVCRWPLIYKGSHFVAARVMHAGLALTLLAAAPCAAFAQAQEAEEEDSGRLTESTQREERTLFPDPLNGMVVNRTVTVLGKDFYRYFSTRWRQSEEASRYTVSIYERPTARFGSEIWVLYRQQRMFHIFLPPARAATRGISEVAVQHVLDNISQRELERMTIRNPDLGPEEL